MHKGRVIVIDDEVNILKMIELSLTSHNFIVEVFNKPTEAIKRIREIYFDMAFIDLKMQPINGLEVLSELKKVSDQTTAVIMTAYSSIETAVEAIKKGAYDYIAKPFNHKEFLYLVDRVYSHLTMEKELRGLKLQVKEQFSSNEIITQNIKMRDIIQIGKDIAGSDIPVLIEGESGTGKELLARYIHEHSQRKDAPFIPINCAAIPENLFESELFGHVKGAFTGAIKDRIGRLEMADNGTIFFDEVAELPKPLQVKLLRFLQNMEFERVGESITRKIQVRIISATNRDIEKDLATGDLRDDFFYRISAVRLKLPALHERKEDIPLLLFNFLKKNNPEIEYDVLPETLKLLSKYDWPGNIREFENVVKRVKVLAKNNCISPELLPIEIQSQEHKKFISVIPNLQEMEKQHIIGILQLTNNPKEAAKILGISETTLWRKRKLFQI
ncbi:MAG: sigma-54 dependent transcriptional regulator [bacterium]